ncbi:MAG: hypothetical protein ACYYK0_02300 [Candidatus Eutrophobiaceae bacterium]
MNKNKTLISILIASAALISGAFAYHYYKVSELIALINAPTSTSGDASSGIGIVDYMELEFRFPYDVAIVHGVTINANGTILSLRRLKISNMETLVFEERKHLSSADFSLEPEALPDMGMLSASALSALRSSVAAGNLHKNEGIMQAILLALPRGMGAELSAQQRLLNALNHFEQHFSSVFQDHQIKNWKIFVSQRYDPANEKLRLHIQTDVDDIGSISLDVALQEFHQNLLLGQNSFQIEFLSVRLAHFGLAFEDAGLYGIFLDGMAELHALSREELLEKLNEKWSVHDGDKHHLGKFPPAVDALARDTLEQGYAFLSMSKPKIGIYMNPQTPVSASEIFLLATTNRDSEMELADKMVQKLGVAIKAE